MCQKGVHPVAIIGYGMHEMEEHAGIPLIDPDISQRITIGGGRERFGISTVWSSRQIEAPLARFPHVDAGLSRADPVAAGRIP